MIQTSRQDVNALVARGIQFHQQGDLPGAERIYLSVMEQAPEHPDALHLLGVLKGQQGFAEAGVGLIEQAIAANPRVSAYHNNLGNLCLKTGDLAQAEQSYRRAVKIDRKNADAHLNLGKLLHQQMQLPAARTCIVESVRLAPRSLEAQMSLGRLEEAAKNLPAALQSYRNAARIAPGYAPAHLAIGNLAKGRNDLDSAIASYQAAIAADPNYADAYFNLANLFRSQRKLMEAATLYRTAISASIGGAGDIYNNLGHTLSELGRPQEAIAALLKVVELSPASHEAWFNLGRAAAAAGDMTAGEQCLARAISINPLYSEAHIELGNLRHREGRLEESAACYRVAVEVAPANAVAHNNLGGVLSGLGRHEEAEAAYRRAIALRPDYDEAYFNLGKEFGVLGDEEAEMEMLQKAITLNAGNASAHTQIGVVLLHRGFLEDAATAFRISLSLDSSSLITRSNLGIVLSLLGDPQGLELLESVVQEKPESADDRWGWGERLLLWGRYEEGWREYEWRKRVGPFVSQHPVLPEPLWTGEPLEGKTILLHAEQGQGDTIQFARYARLVAERGGRVVLEVQRSLHRLLDGIPGVWTCVARGDSLPRFDTYAPLMSLPYLFGTRLESVPPPVVPVVAARSLSGDADKLKVGLVWAGNPKDKRDRLRSSRLADWAGLAEIEGVEFTSLQTDEAASQIEGGPFVFAGDVSGVKDFADTAAIVATLDLVITVDTAMAHLAGSMGKPVWVLIYNVTDWRWGRIGDQTPWYPTARLFRQTTPADWTQVLGEIETSLRELAAKKL